MPTAPADVVPLPRATGTTALRPSQYPAAPPPAAQHPHRLLPPYLLAVAAVLVAGSMVAINAADDPPFLSLTSLPGLTVSLVATRLACRAWTADWERASSAIHASRRAAVITGTISLLLTIFTLMVWAVADRPGLNPPHHTDRPCLDLASAFDSQCASFGVPVNALSPGRSTQNGPVTSITVLDPMQDAALPDGSYGVPESTVTVLDAPDGNQP